MLSRLAPTRRRAHVRLLLAALAVVALAGCGGGPSRGRVVVLALDGVDPDVVERLEAEGRLPNFARLRAEGASGRLRAHRPLLSPVLWTTIATGRPPTDHGIAHFTAVDTATGRTLPVTSRMRRVPALWNFVSDAGRPVAVVGWWATWPAEKVRGAMVTDHVSYHFLLEEGFTGPPEELIANTWPLELEDEIAPLVRRPSDVGPEDVAQVADVDPAELDRPFDFGDDLQHLRWALAAMESHHAIAEHLWRTREPALLMEYVEGTDSVSHLFGHLVGAEGLKGELAAQQARYGRTVEAVYEQADRLVGDWLERLEAEDDVTLVVLSDHGFSLGALHDDPRKAHEMSRVSEQFHEEDGILFLHGRGARPGARLQAPQQLDVAPTLLALLGLPATKAMPGRVLAEGLTLPGWPERVDAAPRDALAAAGTDERVDDAIMERLRSLGYVGAESPAGSRLMANMLFEEGDAAAAEVIYRELLEANPDDASLHASLAGALGAQGRYDETLEALRRALELDPTMAPAWHNRGAALERLGRPGEAVAAYRKALEIDASHEPARQALQALTGSPETRPLATEAEQRAAALAAEARALAVRGDLEAASRTLDEAERIAPHLALVHQHRSNVAFLAGDVEGAKSALRKALAIEPDNPLFQRNLAALEDAGNESGSPR